MIYLVTVFIWVARITLVRVFDKAKYDEVFNDGLHNPDHIKLLVAVVLMLPVYNTFLLLRVVWRKLTA